MGYNTFNVSLKCHHTGHKYKVNFRTIQEEFAATLLHFQNYINPKFNNNFLRKLTITIQSIIT